MSFQSCVRTEGVQSVDVLDSIVTRCSEANSAYGALPRAVVQDQFCINRPVSLAPEMT